MFVRPAPGRAVRDPETKMLVPAEGREVPRTGFWLRRLRDGDGLEGAEPAPQEAEPLHHDMTDSAPSSAAGEQS